MSHFLYDPDKSSVGSVKILARNLEGRKQFSSGIEKNNESGIHKFRSKARRAKK